MSFTSDFLESEKKKKKKTGDSFTDEFLEYEAEREEQASEDIAPVATYKPTKNIGLPKKEEKDESREAFEGGYRFGDLTRLINKYTSDWGITNKNGHWKDGYDFGDVSKTMLASFGDTNLSFFEGVGGLVEGVTDLVGYGVAGVGDALGADDFADDLRKKASENTVQGWGNSARKILGIDTHTLWGDTFRDLNRGLGYVAGSVASAGVAGAAGLGSTAVNLISTGLTGVSSAGSAMGEAYQDGATDEEAATYGLISGVVNAGSEILFGGLGKSVKALGISKGISGLDDLLAKKLSDKISNNFVKISVQYGVKATAEGFEEVLAGLGEAVGKKLTYMKDEDLLKLIEDEKLLEQFAMGTAISGIMQLPDVATSVTTGQDFITGLTSDEQAVIDKEFENRVTEAEKDGKKLTKKEKTKLYDAILNDLEKGYISTDTIEEFIANSDYKSYQDTIKNEDALIKELDELRNMKSGDMTDIQKDRLAELKGMNLTDTTKRDSLKANLSQKVYEQVKGTKLANSYYERARRGQAFEADLSKYNAKQAAIVQKAIDSKILNNTNRTHEFVDLVAKISADKGVPFDFTNNERLKESGFAVEEGVTRNGFVTKDGITINVQSSKALNFVVGHEITHVLEGTKFYDTLQQTLFDYAKAKGEYDSRLESITKLYKKYAPEADPKAELTADLVGDYLFTDKDFVMNLSTKHRNVFQKIYDEIKYLYKMATAGSKEARELEKVKRAFDKAYKESGKGAEGTKYSMSDNTGKALTAEQNEYFKDSKMRDENGNLMVMYHGSQDAGFHIFDSSHSDDGISLFFVDRNEVATSYSGTSETYEAQTIHTAEDMNKFIESIGVEGYEVVEQDGKFTLLYEGDRVAQSDTAKGIYSEFCWYEGVGEGDANYKVYLNLTNPLVVDAKGRPWNKIDAEFSQEIYDKYNSLTAEEKAALVDLAEWEDFSLFNSEIQEARGDALASAYAKMGEDCNIYDLFSVAADNFSEDSMRENARGYLKTRDYAQRAKEGGYDGVIIKNVHDNGGYSNGSEGASTVAIAFSSEQVKSVANEKPTGDPDIRYSLTEYTAEEKKAHNDAVKNHFGKTYSWAETGYLLLDGTKLDLSGKHDGAPGGYRTVDHRDITEALGYDYGGGDYSGSLIQFMSEGNIRIIPEIDGINLSVKPTKAQEQALSEYIFRNRGEVVLDIDDLNGYTVVSVEYPSGTRSTKILNDIREWFDNGVKPENAGNYSLTKNGETPNNRGWNIRGEDVKLETAPTQEEIAPVEDTAAEVAPDNGTTSSEMEQVAPTVDEEVAKKSARPELYNKRDGENGWGKDYGTAQEALNDAVQYVSPELWSAFSEEFDNAPTNENLRGKTPITNALIAVQEDVRQETITPMQGAQLLAETYNSGGVKALEGLYNHATGNLYNRYLEQAKQYETVAPESDVTDVAPLDYSVDEEVAPSMREIYGEEYAPIDHSINYESEVKGVAEEMTRLAEEASRLYGEGKQAEAQAIIERMQELNESTRGDREKYNDLRAQEEAESREYLDSLTDADAPPEVEAPYSESDIIDPFEERDMKEVSKDRQAPAYMYENPEVKPFFQEEAQRLLGEYERGSKAESFYNGHLKRDIAYDFAQDIPEVYRVGRDMSPSIVYLRDTVGMSYGDIEKGLKAIIEDNGAENIAAAKKIEFELNNRLMYGYQDDSYYNIPANQEYRNLIKEKGVTEYNEEAKKAFFESLKQSEPSENIAPLPTYDTASEKQIPGQQTMFEDAKAETAENVAPVADTTTEPAEEPKVAKVLPSTPKEPKKVSLWQKIRNLVFDKQSTIEDLSLKTKNRELMGKADFMLRSESRAQRHIKKKLLPILEKVEKTGKRTEYETYAYHLHNIDRMSLEGNAQARIKELEGKFGHLLPEQIKAIAAQKITEKTTEKTAKTIGEAKEWLDLLEVKNKPVFGDEITADASREFVKNFEAAHADAREFSEAVTEYNNELRQMLVDGGVISQETADLWAEMYPHYVPIRRAGKNGAAVKVPLDSMRTGVNAPIARATGGNSDMESLLDVMGSRTEQVYRAIARNSFGVELMNTLNTVTDTEPTSIEEILDSFESKTDELLKAGENGANPTFTVFVDGKRITFDITEEMYDALKPTNELLKTDVPVMSLLAKIQRGILTQYNPTFIATNATKDIQDVLVNSQHPVKTYANVPLAIKEVFNGLRGKESKWISEYMDNGGEDLTYFDSKKQVFKKDSTVKKVLGFVPDKIAKANDFVEKVPRLAEYIASRKNGASVEVAMLDAARVTTNFAAGGDLTKFANRNGFTFLNASVQGFNQQVRNVREAKANGLKGVMQLAAKFAVAGLPIMLLNALRWEDDEDYEELSDYVKDNYYIVAKYGDGKFVRIPKGRTVAVIQSAFEQMKNLITGDDEVDMARFGQLMVNNLAPNNPLENNVLAPIKNVIENKTWYGGDLVPQRLQDLPDAEQYDETTDSISKWLGELTGQSPYKINYLLDQYSGGLGDVILPMLTPESDGGGFLAPFTDKFTTDSVMKNQNVSDFYTTVDELTKASNSMNATDEDILKSKYMNSVSSELGELYQQKREIQNDSYYTDAEKDKLVRDIQKEIDRIARESLNTYGNVDIEGSYAKVGDRHYRWYEPSEDSEAEAGWQKITDDQLKKQNEVTKGLGISAGEYWSDKKEEYDFAYEYPEKYKFFNDNGISYQTYKNANEDGKRAYSWAYENPGKYTMSKAIADDFLTYYQYKSELYDLEADKDENGKSISGSKKEKVIEYINNMDLDYGQKIILFRSMYDSKEDRNNYNYDIVEYLNSRDDISYDEMVTILKELGFTVDSKGNVYWD